MYLITPSLLNSWKYYISVEDEEKEAEQREKILATFRREEIEPTPIMEFGREFEDDVLKWSDNISFKTTQSHEYGCAVINIGDIVMGGTWQMPCKRTYKDFLLYGRMDVVKGPAIYDIKTTQRYEIGKFRDSAQHRLYLYCTELEYCEYLVAEVYLSKDGPVIKSLSAERYTNRDIEPMVDEFISWLDNDAELKELYFKHWRCKNDTI